MVNFAKGLQDPKEKDLLLEEAIKVEFISCIIHIY